MVTLLDPISDLMNSAGLSDILQAVVDSLGVDTRVGFEAEVNATAEAVHRARARTVRAIFMVLG